MTFQILLWYLVVQACGLAVLPLALRLFGRLPSSGYAFSKPLGLLAVTYGLWLPGLLGYLEYRPATVLAVLLVVAALCWWPAAERTFAWLAARRRQVLWQEALFLAALLVGGFVRSYNADILGQEKFMDLAFYNGFMATSRLPAEDTWLAGYGMAYYPLNYFLLSAPAKLVDLPAAYGYNLALVLVFALTLVLSSELVASLVALASARDAEPGQPPSPAPGPRAWGFGVLGALFVAVCGNLVGPLEVLAARGYGGPGFWSSVGVNGLAPVPGQVGWLPSDGGWWWRSSRVVPTIKPDGITEFPYFSFLLGDLHPHFTALPLLLLIAALALALLRDGRPWTDPLLIVPTGLALGAPLAANTWDAATFWSLYGLAALGVAWRAGRAEGGRPAWLLVWALLPIPLGAALFAPYFVGYASQRLGLGRVTDQTPLVSLLLIFGPFLVAVALLVGRSLLCARPGAVVRPIAAGGLVLTLGLLLGGYFSAALALVLLTLVVLAGQPWLERWPRAEESPRVTGLLYLLGLSGLALAIIVAVEFVYLHDSFGTRMNTVFKFYYHAWLLLGLVAAPAFALALDSPATSRARRPLGAAAGALLAAGLALGLVYPLAATWTKSSGFRGQPTLDGAAFLERRRPADAAAVRWLAAQPGRPIVLEAVGGSYQEYGRVSTFSGLPTVLGWPGHEAQWRGALDELGRRERDVDLVYRQASPEEALQILQRYGVRYVFVGSLEREKYGAGVEARLAGWLRPAFRRDNAIVFAVPPGEAAS